MVKRFAYIVKSSDDGKKHICIDVANEASIIQYLKEKPVRIKKFNYIIDNMLRGFYNSHLYGKEDINEDSKDVTAMKMFQSGENLRIYCKEQTDSNGTFYVIVAELLQKKKDQKVRGKIKQLIQTVSSYEYTIVQRP